MAVVLIVDDHPAVAGAVAELVESDGHEAATVHSGPAALAHIRSRPVDLVVLDVSMPGLSGLDVLRSLAAEGTVPGLPVIMFSSQEAASDQAMRLGAQGYVMKGDSDELRALIERHTVSPAGAGLRPG